MSTREEIMNSKQAEVHVLAAVGGIVVAGNDGEFGTRQPILAEVRGRAPRLTTASLRRL
jgi:hypothetical protein